MLLQNKKVAVVGAGPVGLAFARLLQQEGVNVTVYERDLNKYARIKGGTLDLLKNMGQVVFEKAGLLSAYFDKARPTERRIADIHGRVIQTLPISDNPEIDRNDLRRILLESLHPQTVIWDRKFISLEKKAGRFRLHFDNDITETADLIVGANGIMSRLRKEMTGVPARYTGTVTITGEVLDYASQCPNFKKICADDKIIVRDDHIFFLSQPKTNGELYYYICFRRPESWLKSNNLNLNDNQQICNFLSNLCCGWDNAYKELFAATSGFTLLPMYQVSLENWHAHNNITLIGDAAHGMPPYAGVGVNTGLLDALHLAENLTNRKFENIQAAINDYEQQMFTYAWQAQRQTASNEAALFSKSPKE